MLRKEWQFVGSKNIVDLDAYRDVVLARAERTLFDNDLHDFEKLLEENDNVDMDYKNVLLCILTKKENVEPHKRKEINDEVIKQDDNSDSKKENDPQYECFLKNLKEHGKSYILEYEKDGSPAVVKYERDAKKENGLPHQIVPDLDYLSFLQASTLIDGYFVYTHGGHTVVYEKNGDNDWEKEKEDDGLSSDVEILDSTSFYETGNLNPSVIASTDAPKYMNKGSFNNLGGPVMQSEFRQHVTAVLRKPYDKEEYDKLWKDIKVRKPEVRHLDLRHGREIAYSTNKSGKSYLDRYPDLKRKLVQFQGNKPQCLNLLRGFFFWLQKLMQQGSFEPWRDAECLAIGSEPRQPGISLKMETFN